MRKLAILLIIIIQLLFTSIIFAQDTKTLEELCSEATPAQEPELREFSSAEDVLEEGVDYSAIFCTDVGPIYIDLFEQVTPITVNNFVFLSESGYYNNTTFHRVIADFMAQGGDPTATGTGGPGYRFQDEFIPFLTFDRPGLLAMANSGENTNGSQFFITTALTPHLDYRHSIFGEVWEGQENVESIRLRDPQTDNEPGTALETIVIITDPSTVEKSFVSPERASQTDFEDILSEIPESVGLESVLRSDKLSGVSQTDDITTNDDIRIFLDEHYHEYSVSSVFDNNDCDFSNEPIQSMSYTIHVFATTEDAKSALDDEFAKTFITDDNSVTESTSSFFGATVYSWEITGCNGEPVTQARMARHFGRFILVSESIFQSDFQLTPEEWLDAISFQLFEQVFAVPLRIEIYY